MIPKIQLNAKFHNDQNFYTFLHALNYFSIGSNFVNENDIVKSRYIPNDHLVIISYYRAESKETRDLFCLNPDGNNSTNDMAQLFMQRVKECFAEEFI